MVQPIQIQSGQLPYHHTQFTGDKKGGSSNTTQKRLGGSTTWSQQHTHHRILHMECIKKNKLVHIIGICHPPPYTENATTNAMFLDDLTEIYTDNSHS